MATTKFVTLEGLERFKTLYDAYVGDQTRPLSTKLETLIDQDADKSVRTISAEEVASALASSSADKQTLEEMAKWIEDHPDDAAAMNAELQTIKAILAGIGDTANGEKATVKAYVDEAVANATIDPSQIDLSSKVDKVGTEMTKLAGIAEGATKAEVVAEAFTNATKLATVTINGTPTPINAPAVNVSADHTDGTKLASITVGDAGPVNVFAPFEAVSIQEINDLF